MKVLYISHFKEGTGWGQAAINYILALDAAGVDVVPRAIKLNNAQPEIPERVLELEAKSESGCDVLIQHVLPHLMDYDGRFKLNIGIYFTETTHFRNCSWPERLNAMDWLWVCNEQMLQAARNSHVGTPISIVPIPCDTSRFQKEYERFPIQQIEGRFTFYTIGEMMKRKNFNALVKAFHLEFEPQEPVALLIKSNIPGKPPEFVNNMLKENCNQIKDNLKLYPDRNIYHKEIFLSQHLTEEQMMQLHATCDCYVSSSYCEAWGIPAFDAMGMGKTPICTNIGGPADFVDDGGWLINGMMVPCFGMTGSFGELYVGNEKWLEIDLDHLRETMRFVYEKVDKRQLRSEAGMNRVYNYSHGAVGTIMKDILENPMMSRCENTIAKHHSLKRLLKCQPV